MPWFSWWRKLTAPGAEPIPASGAGSPEPFATVLRLSAAFNALGRQPRQTTGTNGRLLLLRIEETTEGQALLAADAATQRRVLREAIAFLHSDAQPGALSGGVTEVVTTLLHQPLPWDHAELLLILQWATRSIRPYHITGPLVITVLQRYLAAAPLTPELRSEVGQLLAAIEARSPGAAARRVIHTVRELIADPAFVMPLRAGDAWADATITDIGALDPAAQQIWNHLLHRCGEANSSAPTLKWRKAIQPIVATLGEAQVRAMLTRWFPLVDTPRAEAGPPEERWMTSHVLSMYTTNSDILRGLVWLCADHADAAVARAVGALAMSCQRKIPGEGPRLPRITNACIWALGEMPDQVGLAQLAILKIRTRSGSAQRVIERALTAAANHAGLAPADVEELLVPTYGLTDVGVRAETLGAFTAEVEVQRTTTVALSWRKADGKRVAAVPRAVKDDHAEALADLVGAVKDIKKMLLVQRDRIEHLYLERTTWPFATWKERYLDHPLVGTLARRMIWRFERGEQRASGVWHAGHMVGADDVAIAWLGDDTVVELWHPLHDAPHAVQAWRAWLMAHEVQQPFKQAHREVYVVTDAEHRTRLYSNRFAAHILRQHQFHSLTSLRRWKNKLRLSVDDAYGPAERRLAAWGLRAEFWIEGSGQDYGIDTNESGTYLYLSTDQVRFYPVDAPQHSAHASGGGYHLYLPHGVVAVDPVAQGDVPALVFSEIMRDVDLFVGVASIGNDPTWVDGGNERPHQRYWASYAFGDLAETAKMRREVLEGIVPRLKISARCTFRDRFLVVRGDLHTYKIHMGSGNILMEPNDQYLCIVPGRGEPQATPVFLPFEGDRTLVLILSKALLLANDTAITDPVIVRQLAPRA